MTTIVLTSTITVLTTVLLITFAYPVFSDKIYRTPTGVIVSAMLIPVLLVTGWNIEVERLPNWGLHYHDGSLVDHPRSRVVINVDLAIYARLANPNGYTHIGLSETARQGTQANSHYAEFFR
jgi:hypothetical protein